jgi:hypothetical protein
MTKEETIMPILDAALAFALTMLAVATAATQIVRIIQHFTEKSGDDLPITRRLDRGLRDRARV